MYSITKMDYGYKLVFGNSITKEEMEKWVSESETALANAPAEFGVFVDMRTLKPLLPEVQEIMINGQAKYKKAGMVRSVVILNNPTVTLQFKRLAKESGIYEWERYIDASTITDWEVKGVAWVKDAKDPDK